MTTLSQTTIDQMITEWVMLNPDFTACEPITFRNAETEDWEWVLIDHNWPDEEPQVIDLEDYFFHFAHECYGQHYPATEEGVLSFNLNEEKQIEMRPKGKPHRVMLGSLMTLTGTSVEELNEMVDECDYVRENGLLPVGIEFVLADNKVLYAFFENANQ